MNNVNKVNFILKFGKYKGQKFGNTPTSYQDWLVKQDFFKASKEYMLMRTCACDGLKKTIEDEDCGDNCELRFNGKIICRKTHNF